MSVADISVSIVANSIVFILVVGLVVGDLRSLLLKLICLGIGNLLRGGLRSVYLGVQGLRISPRHKRTDWNLIFRILI